MFCSWQLSLASQLYAMVVWIFLRPFVRLKAKLNGKIAEIDWGLVNFYLCILLAITLWYCKNAAFRMQFSCIALDVYFFCYASSPFFHPQYTFSS